MAAAALLSVPSLGHAQDTKLSALPPAGAPIQTQSENAISSGLQFNLPNNTARPNDVGAELNFRALNLDGLSFDDQNLDDLTLPNSLLGSSVFNLDVLDTACITGQGSCLVDNSRADLGLTTLFSTNPESKLGISLRPRAALRITDDGSSALVGGVVEFSKKSKSGAGLDNNTWYFFAGADAESVNYSNANGADFSRDTFSLQDRIFVGDAKAGLGYRIGGADLSLSYLRRQATSDELTYKEDAAALSFTWKR